MLTSQQSSGGLRLMGEAASGTPDRPLVTIITAVYNASDCIATCIESVLAQDYPNREHILIDACSKDGTLEIIRSYERRIDYWISEPDKGIFDAWNKGLELARGEWIAFLGADDRYLPHALSTYMDLARTHPDALFLSSRAKLDHPSGHSPTFGGPWEWPRFSKAMTTVHVGSMHHRTLFERYGTFDISYRMAGDYEFMLRAGDSLTTAFTPEVTVIQRAGGESDSTAGLHEARRAKVKARLATPLSSALYLWKASMRFYVRRFALRLFALWKRRT
jgi:glycosyltransferase involved in cell wall biosynthesis